MIELLLTRHGETLENKRDIMQGHMPGTLSPLGIRQARTVGRYAGRREGGCDCLQ